MQSDKNDEYESAFHHYNIQRTKYSHNTHSLPVVIRAFRLIQKKREYPVPSFSS